MEEDYNKHSDPNWAKFIDGKLDLPTAFWGFLVGGSIVLIAVFSLSMYVGFYSQDKITYTFLGIYILFNCNRVWTCASKYSIEKNKKNKSAVWGMLTQCVCALLAIFTIASLYDLYAN